MLYTEQNTKFIDKDGLIYLINQLREDIENIDTSNIDLSNYVTNEQLQEALRNAGVDVDLSTYATKEELLEAINSIDLSAYALKTEIPSIDGLATTEYVDNAVANIPTGDGGNVDLSNYYTKDETYSKTEVDTAIENALYGSYTFDPNFDFSGKTLYFDTTKNLASMLPEEQYILYISDPTSTGYNYGQSIAWNEFSNSPNGRLTLTMGIDDTGFGVRSNIILYDINCADGETSQMGTFNNHWATSSYTFSSKFKTPVYGDFGDTSRSILGEELFNAFMSCVTRVVDADGNEVSFKIFNEPEEIISPTVSITETDNGHTVSITDVNGTQSFEVTNGQNGVSPTVTVTKEGKVANITCTDVNGTTTATISDGEGGSSSGGSSGGASDVYSTEETAIGTWIDGSTIYRKVIEVGKLASVSSGNYSTVTTTFSDVACGELLRMTGIIKYSTTSRIVVDGGFSNLQLNPSTTHSTYIKDVEKSRLTLIGSSTSVKLWYGADWGGYNYTLIVEYTKSA